VPLRLIIVVVVIQRREVGIVPRRRDARSEGRGYSQVNHRNERDDAGRWKLGRVERSRYVARLRLANVKRARYNEPMVVDKQSCLQIANPEVLAPVSRGA